MPRRKFIDKKNATTFQVLHRPQHDPRIYDDATPSVVFQETGTPSTSASSAYGAPASSSSAAVGQFTTLDDLASQYGGSIRGNEGEAAEYGVYYDDTEYDYMQHMRDLGSGGEAQWVEAKLSQSKKQGKRKQDLADALRDMNIAQGREGSDEEEAPSLVPASIPADARSAYSLPSWASEKSHTDRVIESQLDVPTDIAGFQPDMDPRLREVLEALQDDAYVDEADEDDVFGKLSGEGVEVSLDEFERLGDFMVDEEEDGWESDDTVKALEQSPRPASGGGVTLGAVQHPADTGAIPGAAQVGSEEDGAWLSEYSKFKKDQKSGAPAVAAPSTLMTGATSTSRLWDLPDPARKKKRKGALTEDSSYSMTSSSLFRNDNQTLLDRRFDKMETDYAADALDEFDADDNMSMASGATGLTNKTSTSAVSGFSSYSRASAMSQQPKGLRSDFDGMMDDFLGPAKTAAMSRRGGKSNRNRNGAGLEQLEEIRKGMGPARVNRPAQKA